MNKLLLESFEGDVIISRAHSEDGNEIAIRTKRRDGSGDDYYFITLQEMRELVENFTAVDLILTKDESGCNHLIKVVSADGDWPVAFVRESGGMVTAASQLTSFIYCPKCGAEL